MVCETWDLDRHGGHRELSEEGSRPASLLRGGSPTGTEWVTHGHGRMQRPGGRRLPKASWLTWRKAGLDLRWDGAELPPTSRTLPWGARRWPRKSAGGTVSAGEGQA